MKKIILCANSKGGCGKSTLAVNLAIDLSQRHDVKIIDADFQRSTSIFNHNRKKAGLDPLVIVSAADDKKLRDEISNNDKIMIIDTGAFDTPAYRQAMLKADMILCPTSDSSYDLYGLLLFAQKFEEVRKINKKFRLFVLANRIEPRSKGYAEIEAFVKDNKGLFVLLKGKLSARKEFKTAFDDGQGVTEIKGSTAGREVRALGKEVETWLKVK